jgi:phosphoglycerate dehydrogenase-like enzyme
LRRRRELVKPPVVAEHAIATDYAELTILDTADDEARHGLVELRGDTVGHAGCGRRGDRVVGSDAPGRAAVRVWSVHSRER